MTLNCFSIMITLLEFTTKRAVRYLESLITRPVAPSPEAVLKTDDFDHDQAEDQTDPEEVIRQLDEIGSPATIAMGGPRFFGFVIGGALSFAQPRIDAEAHRPIAFRSLLLLGKH